MDNSNITNVMIPHKSGKYFSVFLNDEEIKKMEEDSKYRTQIYDKYDALYRHNLISAFELNQFPGMVTDSSAAVEIDTGLSEPTVLGIDNAGLSQYTVLPDPGGSSHPQKTHHNWTTNETLALIRSMENHFEELKHPKKRKYVFDNVSNDLISLGFSVCSTNCQTKWKNLVRTYTTAKDAKNKTGRGPSRFQFFSEMDELLGHRPSSKCTHSMESSTETEDVIEPSPEPPDEEVSGETPLAEAPKETNIKKRKAGTLELKKSREESKNKRHLERLEIEKQKIEVEKEKLAVLREYIELKKMGLKNILLMKFLPFLCLVEMKSVCFCQTKR